MRTRRLLRVVGLRHRGRSHFIPAIEMGADWDAEDAARRVALARSWSEMSLWESPTTICGKAPPFTESSHEQLCRSCVTGACAPNDPFSAAPPELR